MKRIEVTIDKWDISSEQIKMHDVNGKQYYLENCLPKDGRDAANVNPIPRFNVLGQLYTYDKVNKKEVDLGMWILHSNDTKTGILNPKGEC